MFPSDSTDPVKTGEERELFRFLPSSDFRHYQLQQFWLVYILFKHFPSFTSRISFPNNDHFIAGAYGSDNFDEFFQIEDDDVIDQDPSVSVRALQGQPENTLFHQIRQQR